jgi:hypothetical protein
MNLYQKWMCLRKSICNNNVGCDFLMVQLGDENPIFGVKTRVITIEYIPVSVLTDLFTRKKM